MSDSNYDVIIIGSGIAGLICGILLAKNGLKTLILEKHVRPGGYCCTFKRGDYNFDATLHMINGCSPGWKVYEILKEAGVKISYYQPGDEVGTIEPDEVRFIKLDNINRTINLTNDLDFTTPANLEEYEKRLIEKFPHQADNLRKLINDCKNILLFGYDFQKAGKLGKLKLIFSRFSVVRKFLKSFKSTAKDLFDKYSINDPNLISILAELCKFFALPPEQLSQTIYLLGAFSYYFQGAFQVIGGSGAFASAITYKFQEFGGELKLKALASEILIDEKSNRVSGVKLSDGTIYNSRFVVSNADATYTFNELIKTNNSFLNSNKKLVKFIDNINKREVSLSAVVVYIGLDLDLKKYGINDYELSFDEGIKPITWDETLQIIKKAEFEQIPGLSIAIHSNIDPTYCPEGKSVLSSVFLADIEPFKDLLDSDGTRGERYFELKEKIAENVIQKASNYLGIPDLANHVEIFDVATPLTLQRYTNNKNGAFIGWKVIPEQQIQNQISPETPIKNLYLASAWTLYGAGISGVMMNGEEVAKKILKKVK